MSEKVQKCSSVILQINQASTESVTIEVAKGSVDRVSATWFYENSTPIQKEGQIREGEATLQSDNPGEALNSVEVKAPNCPGAAPATYP